MSGCRVSECYVFNGFAVMIVLWFFVESDCACAGTGFQPGFDSLWVPVEATSSNLVALGVIPGAEDRVMGQPEYPHSVLQLSQLPVPDSSIPVPPDFAIQMVFRHAHVQGVGIQWDGPRGLLSTVGLSWNQLAYFEPIVTQRGGWMTVQTQNLDASYDCQVLWEYFTDHVAFRDMLLAAATHFITQFPGIQCEAPYFYLGGRWLAWYTMMQQDENYGWASRANWPDVVWVAWVFFKLLNDKVSQLSLETMTTVSESL